MRSSYVRLVAIPTYDATISKVVEEATADCGGKTMRIAIENDESMVYRVIETDGLGELVALVEALKRLGGGDRLADRTGVSPEGYDYRFHF